MNTLAMQVIDEDLEAVADKDRRWHQLSDWLGDTAILCTGEFVNEGAGAGTYVLKTVKRRGITCEACIGIIKQIKSIKL